MKPEAQRIAIATACGWTAVKNDGVVGGFIAKSPAGAYSGFVCGTADRAIECDSPEYTANLNACYEMETNLGDKQQEYAMALLLVQRCQERPEAFRRSELQKTFDAIHATAAQRAEAFLKTLGLWTP